MKYIKSIFVIALGMLFPLLSIAQEGPKSVYMSPEGKLYVKSKEPIYLRLTTSADDNAQSYLLRNEMSVGLKQQPKPFNFEGHGRHTIQHAADHRIPQKKKELHLFYVYDDGKSPRSKISVTKAPWVYNGGVNIYGKPVKISIKTKDESSGVFASYYAIDATDFSRYNTPISLEQELDYKLRLYAIDNVGNKSKVRTRLYSLDFTPPVTKHKIVGGYINLNGLEVLSPRSKVHLKSRDAKAGVKQIRYRFKDKKGIYKGRLLTMKGLKDGTHSLVYAAEDRVENAEMNKTFTFYLDSIPPIVSHSLLGDQYRSKKKVYVSGRTTVELSATDNKAGVRRIRYYLKSRSGEIYSSPFGFPRKNGKLTYSYAASDNVINISKTIKRTVIVDISSPKIIPKFKGEHYFSRKTHYIRLSTKITLPTTDNLSGVKSVAYTLDADPEVSYKRSFTIKTEGEHSLAYTASDNVNNIRNREIKLYVDEKAPEIYHHFSVNPTVPATDTYPLKSLLYLAATDKQSGIRNIYYSINGKKEIKYKKPLSFRKRMTYNIKIRAIDNVGNVSTSRVDFKIK